MDGQSPFGDRTSAFGFVLHLQGVSRARARVLFVFVLEVQLATFCELPLIDKVVGVGWVHPTLVSQGLELGESRWQDQFPHFDLVIPSRKLCTVMAQLRHSWCGLGLGLFGGVLG